MAVAAKSKSGVAADKRIEIAQKSVYELPSVSVLPFDGLLTDFLRENNCKFLVRGVRNTVDFEYEKNLHHLYAEMMPEIEIFYLFADSKSEFISSSNVRDILSFGGNADKYVSKNALPCIKAEYSALKK